MSDTPQEQDDVDNMHYELDEAYHDPLIRNLHKLIRHCVRILAVLMVVVIALGTVDVVFELYYALSEPPYFHLDVNEMFKAFGAFMVVLIAIEIFINIRLYLGSSTLPMKLVLGTALMAIARKVIVLDIEKTDAQYVFAIGVVVIALGVAYWLVGKTNSGDADNHR